MSNLYEQWNKSVPTVYDSDTLSTIELIEEITNFNDEIAKGVDDLNVSIEIIMEKIKINPLDSLTIKEGENWVVE